MCLSVLERNKFVNCFGLCKKRFPMVISQLILKCSVHGFVEEIFKSNSFLFLILGLWVEKFRLASPKLTLPCGVIEMSENLGGNFCVFSKKFRE